MDDQVAVDAKRILLRYGVPISVLDKIDTKSRIQLALLRGHTDYVFSLALSPDGQLIASSSGDGTVRIWESTPLRKRIAAMRTAELLRPRAESLVDDMFQQHGEADKVVESIQGNAELSVDLRREALVAVMRRTHE